MDELVSQLTEMGFPEDHVRKAVNVLGHVDAQSVIDWMFAHPLASGVEEEAPIPAPPLIDLAPPAAPVASNIPEPPPQPPVEPFQLKEGFIPPPAPPPPTPMDLGLPEVAKEATFTDKIAETASVRGTSTFHPKGMTGRVGLQNQGATCYLNSLLQTLFLDPSFRSVVYSFRYNEAKDGVQKDCIPFQLQLLFAELQIGENGVAKTGALTDSFGWTNGQQYEQHDVQELMRVLLNAVEESFKEKQSDPDTKITPLYSGRFEDYLECLECGHKKSRMDPYSDVQLFIEKASSIREAFGTFVTPETLNKDNKITCERCQTKVDANKGLKIIDVPRVLTLQLKRFTYDSVTWQRIKLSKKVTYPLYLNMAEFVNVARVEPREETEEELMRCPTAEELDDPKNMWYELFSILIHSGGALGGHYYAYCKDMQTGDWFNFNDMDVRSITVKDALSMCGQDGPQVSSTNAYMLLYRRIDRTEKYDSIANNVIPDYIKHLIETENEGIKEKKQEYEAAMRNVSLNVYVADGGDPTVMQVERKLKLAEAARVLASNLKLPLEGHDYRIALYLPKRAKVTLESLIGKEEETLMTLGFHNNKNIMLQSKLSSENWPAEIPSFALEIVMANQGRSKFEEPRFINVRADATVRQLMNLIYELYKGNGIFLDKNDIALVRIHGESFEHTSRYANWNKPLNDLGIIDGARIYAESRLRGEEERSDYYSKVDWDHLKPLEEKQLTNLDQIYSKVAETIGENAPGTEDVSEWNSFVVQQFEVQRNTIEIFYNIPGKTQLEEMIEIDQRLPLKQLRTRLAAALKLEPNQFVIRKNLDKKELREDDVSLANLKIFTGNALLLELGTPMAVEQYKIRLNFFNPELDDAVCFTFVGECPVKKDQTLASFKEEVAKVLIEKKLLPADFSGYVRMCEKMGFKLSKTLLGDDKLVGQVIPYLRDGYELCAQGLPQRDALCNEDEFLIHLKRWNRDSSGQLQVGVDEIIVNKSWTLYQIKCAIQTKFNVPVERIMISKPFRSLLSQLSTVLEAIQSVHWDVDVQSVATKSPWYLTSGELIMWKDAQDAEKHVEFLESMYGAPTLAPGQARPAEHGIKILSKFDRAELEMKKESEGQSTETTATTTVATSSTGAPPPPPPPPPPSAGK